MLRTWQNDLEILKHHVATDGVSAGDQIDKVNLRKLRAEGYIGYDHSREIYVATVAGKRAWARWRHIYAIWNAARRCKWLIRERTGKGPETGHMTRLALTLALCLTACTPAMADAIRVVDGDTIDIGRPDNVRLTLDGGASFDTPETWRPDCEFEAFWGATATDRLQELLASGEVTLTLLPGRGYYGRYLGALQVDGVNVGDTLIAEGLAQPVRNFDWCGGR